MKFVTTFSFLLFSSISFAGNIGGLTPFSTTNYKCQLISSNGETSHLFMTIKEYFRPNSKESNWAQLKLNFNLPLDLHAIERDPVGIFPSIIPSFPKNTNVKIVDSYLAGNTSREAALNELFQITLPIKFYLSTYLKDTWEAPFIQFQKISAEEVSFSLETLERHSNQYIKNLDLNGRCEVI